MQDLSIFTAAMKKEFLYGQMFVADPAPYLSFTKIVPSTARIENYPWMRPLPLMKRYVGYRVWNTTEPSLYSVENKEYDKAIQIPLRDIEDDQAGGYGQMIRGMSMESGEPFRSREVLQTLAKGTSLLCWDGTPMFATSHNLGAANAAPSGFSGGGNLLGFTSTNSSDGVIHQFAIMVQTNPVMLPMFLQVRKPVVMHTDAGSPESYKAKQISYWFDGEIAIAFSFWYDAILVQIKNSPSLTELFQCIDAAQQSLYGFQLPKGDDNDPVQRVHEQMLFNDKTASIVCSTGLTALFQHLLWEDRVGVSVPGSNAGITSNIYYKRFNMIHSGYLDNASWQF